MAIDSRKPKGTVDELVERLMRYPELHAGVEEYLDVVENCAGDVAKADEAEHRLIELMRRMGHDGMQAWAERKHTKVEGESDKRSDLTRKEKKGSIGTRRSGK
jgi:hypothetical protein